MLATLIIVSGSTGISGSDDPLWDSEQCLPGNSYCDRGQPWSFHQHTISETHLEVRICQDELSSFESVTVEKLQLFVQQAPATYPGTRWITEVSVCKLVVVVTFMYI